MNKYNYPEIGNRIRYEREKLRCEVYSDRMGDLVIEILPHKTNGLKMTQTRFLQYLRQKGYPCLGGNRKRLSDLENGDEMIIRSLSLDQWIAFCEVFVCDLEYLLAEIKCKHKDTQFICDQTGLSEDVVELFKYWKNNNPDWINHVSSIFQEVDMIEVMRYFSELASNSRYQRPNIMKPNNILLTSRETLTHKIAKNFENIAEKIYIKMLSRSFDPDNTDGDPYYNFDNEEKTNIIYEKNIRVVPQHK